MNIVVSILVVIVVLGVIATVHELAHYFVAKLLKIKAFEVSIFVGPKLISWKRKGVDTEEGAYALPDTYGVFGFTLNPLYHINHWLNIGASLDGAYDGSANIEIDPEVLTKTYWSGTDDDIHTAPWYRRVTLGLSARTEFVMPYFTINFGIGHNFINAGTADFKGFYEILALKINVMRQAYLHIGYSLYDFYYPNNLMLGIGLHL